jgi:Fic family protein
MPGVEFSSPIASILFELERIRGGWGTAGLPDPWNVQILEALGANDGPDSPASLDEEYLCGLRRHVGGEYGGEYRHLDYIPGLVRDLLRFADESFPPQYDFLKAAVVFRRFLWISPFITGNTEVARMLAAALVRRALPGALFDAAKVFEDGDSENRKGLDYWCARILGNLAEQLRLAHRLRDADSLRRDVLEPAVRELCRTRAVTRDETRALEVALEKPEISAQDLSGIWADQFLRSRSIRKMLEAGFLRPVREGARKYTLNFSNFALVKF